MSANKYDWLKKVLSIALKVFGALLVAIIAVQSELLMDVLKWCFQHLPEKGQIVVILAVITGLVFFAAEALVREYKNSEIKAENKSLKEQLDAANATQSRLDDEAITDVWQRPDLDRIRFVESRSRRARFISFLNLKGGPGKTTLSANLAGCFASMDSPLNVLVIDLDFQGTLSSKCVESGFLRHQLRCALTSAKLLDAGTSVEDVNNLMVDMGGVPNAKVIIADDRLALADYTAQARFFLDVDSKRDVRFCYRRLLHDPAIADKFDLVIFDCPPRLTTSTVNALACSDYIIIPSEFDANSYDAVPRTVEIVSEKLLNITRHSKILGIVANKAQYWRGKLTKAHKNGLANLGTAVRKPDNDLYIFSAVIPLATAISSTEKRGIIQSSDPKIRPLFVDLANEIRNRIGK